LGARDVGALHKRERWYCLCYKGAVDLGGMKINTKKILFNKWNDACNDASCGGVSKIVELKSKKQKNILLKRCQMLGNAVVPQCAMYAWNCLVDAIARGTKGKVEVSPFKRNGPQGLVFSDGVRTERADFWHTPCRAIWHHYRSITTRGIKVLSNQLYYSVDSRVGKSDNEKKDNINKYFSNPVFVEFLMGYPREWTQLIKQLY
jgi:hypothetical protein